MKKPKLTMLKTTIMLAISIITSIAHATNVYLENSYGAPLKYILTGPNVTPLEEHLLGINLRSESIGELNSIPRLFIRTTGKGSGYGLSPYNDLDYYLAQLKMQEYNHPNSDAIINISSGYGKWSITVYWEKKGLYLKTFSMSEEKFMALDNATARLEAIKNGAFGEDYAKKAIDICSADYSVARSKGFIDLCSQLQKTLTEMPYIKAQPKKGNIRPDIKPTIDEIKNSIDLLSRNLTKYFSKGYAS